MEKARLVSLLWVPHFHHAKITIFVLKKLLFLVYDGYLWLDEPIPITTGLIHHISQLPYKGKYPTTMVRGEGSDLALAEAMKMKYKMGKKKRGYGISNIKDKWVCVATQILANRVMRKCRADEVLALVVALAEQCMEGFQFN